MTKKELDEKARQLALYIKSFLEANEVTLCIEVDSDDEGNFLDIFLYQKGIKGRTTASASDIAKPKFISECSATITHHDLKNHE